MGDVDGEASPPTGDEDPREPYEPPAMEVEALYEVLALSCGKVQSRPPHNCIMSNRVS